MIATMTWKFDLLGGRYSILAAQEYRCWIMEREWKFNERNVSSVPRDEYSLERHSSRKYPETWAVIGDGVSHFPEEGIPRFACVFHLATFPAELEGCLAPCKAVSGAGMAVDSWLAMDELRGVFNGASGPIKILMQ